MLNFKNFFKKLPKLNFKIIREIFQNRLQRFSMCAKPEHEQEVTEEETILGSRQRVIELGLRYKAFENDEVFLQEALTFLFIQRKLPAKNNYTFEEVVKIVNEAMAERNRFLIECQKQAR